MVRVGDRGEAVRQAQRQLNKLGSLLAEDGVFGRGCAAAVLDCRKQLGLAGGSDYDDEFDATLQQQPEPLPGVDIHAITFIALQEIGSRDLYDRRNSLPTFPGGESGITIGVGYDLRFARDTFRADWAELLPASSIEALAPWTGCQGNAEGARSLSTIRVPWSDAWRVFTRNTLPRTLQTVQRVFVGQQALSPLSRGVIVSLVYNRGAGMDGDSRREMREVREAIAQRRLNDVAPAISSMKRLWPSAPGLQKRRDLEAALFTAGLQ